MERRSDERKEAGMRVTIWMMPDTKFLGTSLAGILYAGFLSAGFLRAFHR
jgi:hypothetical protein